MTNISTRTYIAIVGVSVIALMSTVTFVNAENTGVKAEGEAYMGARLFQDVQAKGQDVIEKMRADLQTGVDVEARQEASLEMRAEQKNRIEAEHSARVEFRANVKADLDAATTAEERKEILEKAQKEREERREEMLEQRAAARADIQARRAELHTQANGVMLVTVRAVLTRLAAGVERFTTLLDRVDLYLDGQVEAGVDVTAAANAVTDARAEVSAAYDAVVSAETVISTALASGVLADYKDEGVAAMRAAIQAVQNARVKTGAAIRASQTLEVNN